MVECPDCKSHSVESKGYKTVKGGHAHRYLCNDCGRNFTVNPYKVEKEKLPEKIQEEVNSVEGEIKMTQEEKMKTISVSEEVHQWLTSLKVIPQEPYNSVLKRLMEAEHDL